MKVRSLLLLLMIILSLTGCNELTNDRIIERTKENLGRISSYQCRVAVEVFGNKNAQLYELKHFYKDGKYRIESIHPEHLRGKIVVIDNQQAKIYHPNIHRSIILHNIQENAYESLFLGDFIHWVFQEDMEYSEEEEEDKKYIVLTKTINQGEDYHHKQSLWIDKNSKLPQYIKIFDKQGNIRVNITIKDLVVNEDLGDELFELAL